MKGEDSMKIAYISRLDALKAVSEACRYPQGEGLGGAYLLYYSHPHQAEAEACHA
jgi:hypothetical protein